MQQENKFQGFEGLVQNMTIQIAGHKIMSNSPAVGGPTPVINIPDLQNLKTENSHYYRVKKNEQHCFHFLKEQDIVTI